MSGWDLEESHANLDMISKLDGISLWQRIKHGWHQHSYLWGVWNRLREKSLAGPGDATKAVDSPLVDRPLARY